MPSRRSLGFMLKVCGEILCQKSWRSLQIAAIARQLVGSFLLVAGHAHNCEDWEDGKYGVKLSRHGFWEAMYHPTSVAR